MPLPLVPCTALAVGFVLLAGQALTDSERAFLAEVERAKLRGITQATITVEDLSEDADRCNVHRDGLELAASRSLVDGDIKVLTRGLPKTDTSKAVTVYVRATVGQTGTSCFASVETRAVLYSVPVQLPYSPPGTSQVLADIVVWDDGKTIAGPASDFGSRVTSAVRDYVERFATRVKLANQR